MDKKQIADDKERIIASPSEGRDQTGHGGDVVLGCQEKKKRKK
jgi:hypothetical protein